MKIKQINKRCEKQRNKNFSSLIIVKKKIQMTHQINRKHKRLKRQMSFKVVNVVLEWLNNTIIQLITPRNLNLLKQRSPPYKLPTLQTLQLQNSPTFKKCTVTKVKTSSNRTIKKTNLKTNKLSKITKKSNQQQLLAWNLTQKNSKWWSI